MKLTEKHRQHLKHLLFNDACSMYQAGMNHNASDRSCCMDQWEDNIRSGFKENYETAEARYKKNFALNKDPDGATGPDGHLVKGKLAFANAHLQPDRPPGEDFPVQELTKEIVIEVEKYAEEFATKYFNLYVERGGR